MKEQRLGGQLDLMANPKPRLDETVQAIHACPGNYPHQGFSVAWFHFRTIAVRSRASSLGVHPDLGIDSRSAESPLDAELESRQVALLGEAVHGLVRHLKQASDLGDGNDIVVARQSYSLERSSWRNSLRISSIG